ncbi:MAG: RecQ family ATP-dependent DNA helicase [Crocinitomicaceae bacterium]
MEKSVEILREYWGHHQFRPLQEEIVDASIYGHDVFAILPTGGGKSVCFQVPGIAREGITLIISPLIALMQDQVRTLKEMGLNAVMLSSDMKYREIDIALDNARFGNTQFLYLSPERLKSSLFLERFKAMDIGLIVVDEAHCISQWGHDFRPSYQEIGKIRELHPEVPMMAVTASATEQVKNEIIELLHLRNPKTFIGNTFRPNIHYSVNESENKDVDILNFCKERINETGIIYCSTRKKVKELTRKLRAINISAGFYHGGLSANDRKFMLDSWMNGSLNVMVATNAFGMGVDKADVRFVLHHDIPSSIEAYYQEAGRAGRDGKSAQAILFWEFADLTSNTDGIQAKFPDPEELKKTYAALCNHLSIAFGSGEDETYEFDLIAFTKNYDLAIAKAYYHLKALQLNERLTFSEKSFQPTKLKFAVNNSTLYKFQVNHDSLSSLITLLTRSYPGIFEYFVSLNEMEIAKRLKISTDKLRLQLQQLEQFGLIDISYQSDKPRITFQVPRPSSNDSPVTTAHYNHRKQVELEKVKAMNDYALSNDCRSSLISAYFDLDPRDCGVCDNCKRKTSATYTTKELKLLIQEQLPASINELSHRNNSDRKQVIKALRELTLEEKVIFENDQYLLRH